MPKDLKKINWENFLAEHDMHFKGIPNNWHDAPHFGNAMIGSMLFVENHKLCLEIFRADVCDHRDETHGWTAYSRPHYRIGKFILACKGDITEVKWHKSLWNAEMSGVIYTKCGSLQIQHMVHAIDMAIITELTASDGEEILNWNWFPVEAKSTRGGYPTDEDGNKRFARVYGSHYLETLKPLTVNPAGRLEKKDDVNIWIQDLQAGGQYATAWSEQNNDNTHTHTVTIANQYPEANAELQAYENIVLCSNKDSAEIISSHQAWWHNYYPQSYLSIPDKKLESLYWQTIYRYGCLSRTGRYYVDTSGLWFQGAQWPYSTHDWNTQAAHWGIYTANRLEQGQEVVERLHKNSNNLIDAVLPEEWREDSAYLHLATAGDMIGSRRADKRYYDCVGCLPWLLHNAWWQYRFSMDDEMLKDKIFPILRRSINFYLHMVYKDDTGKFHLDPTYSPESGTFKDANFDLALFKWGCHILLKTCKRLKIADPLIPRWTEMVEKLVNFPTDKNGFMFGTEQTAWENHRHLSHLLMIYPLYLVNIEQEGTTELLERSYKLAHNGQGSEGSMDSENLHGMVQSHAGPIGTAIGDGDHALEGLKRIESELHPNGLWSCSDNPCIESTVSIVNNIQEMLLQSWCDPSIESESIIRIFPALPSTWLDLEFHDLRTEGAFLISAKRIAGLTEYVQIKSLAGEICRVKPDFNNFRAEGTREFKIHTLTDGVIEIDLLKNEQITLLRTI
jgi:alpha-L-fucosidase 2